MVCAELDAFGIELDDDLNSLSTKGNRAIHAEGSRVEIWVIPTDEELEIARQTYSLYADTPGVRRS